MFNKKQTFFTNKFSRENLEPDNILRIIASNYIKPYNVYVLQQFLNTSSLATEKENNKQKWQNGEKQTSTSQTSK